MLATRGYSRLARDEAGTTGGVEDVDPAVERRLKSMEARRRIRNKIEAVAWCIAAGACMYYGDGRRDFFTILWRDRRIHRGWFNTGCALIGLNTLIFLYLAVWLRYVQKNYEEWEVAAPMAIPLATVSGLIAGFSLVIGLWPVWSFLTPVLLAVLFMGFIMINHFIPSWIFGTPPPTPPTGTPKKKAKNKESQH